MAKTATEIPEVINNFNVYKSGNLLIGTSGEVPLPDFEPITETIEGAGILGEYDTSILGHFGSMEQELPFRMVDDDYFDMMDPTELIDLTYRASQQSTVRATCALNYKQMRVVIRGKYKKSKGGTLSKGKRMNASVTIELLYILIEIDGKSKLELDKLNSVYKVNGKDILEKVRSQC